MRKRDPEKQAIYRDTWYRKNKRKVLDGNNRRRREALKELDEYKKSLSCSECGFSFYEFPFCCDFHHVGDDKAGEVRALIGKGKKAMWREVAKCIPLCANCHRKKHYGPVV